MWRGFTLCALATVGLQTGFAAEVSIGPHRLRIPDGFEIQLVAGPDLAERPIAVARDESGALYVTDSAGMSDRADKQLELKPHRIRKLTDLDGDGVYDKSTLFAEGMMFPEGCMWYEGSLYVGAPPEIWKLTDTDGDGKSDHREVWFNGGTLTGCGNDMHGPYLGPDGWFYWCKGAFQEQKHMVHGRLFTTRSSHIFRSLPDGSRLEPVLTGGMDNPVNVAFLQNGERFLSCTFFQNPANGQRDGLIHSVYGGVYGKRHDSIFEHQQTGDIMPVLVHEGAAAPCGLIGGSSRLFGENQAPDRLYACYFNLHKVVEHTLVENGSTYTTQDRDLVACDHPDFHPTDVFEDADGSLLIVDTGGWYKVCCPTSQLAKPDVLGSIYRLRRTGQYKYDGASPLGPRNWKNLKDEDIVARLYDVPEYSPFSQQAAIKELRKRGESAIKALGKIEHFEEYSAHAPLRQRVLWLLAGMDLPAARAKVRELLAAETDPQVQATGLQVVSLWRDAEAFDIVVPLLQSTEPRVTRMAAEALGRMGDNRAIPLLMAALEQLPTHAADGQSLSLDDTGAPADPAARVQEHALIYALIELGDWEGTLAALTASSPNIQRAALVALDQMHDSTLDVASVIPFLDQPQPALARTAAWVVGHHPEWGAALVDSFKAQLNHLPQEAEHRQQLAAQLGRLAKSEPIQQLLQQVLEQSTPEQGRIALAAMNGAGLTAIPAAWLDSTAKVIANSKSPLRAETIVAVRQWPMPKDGHAALRAALISAGQEQKLAAPIRLDALEAAGPLQTVDQKTLRWLISSAETDPQLGLRGGASRILGAAQLSEDQQLQMVSLVDQAGPFELPLLLPAFNCGSETLGQSLLTALDRSPGLRGLRVDHLRTWMTKYPPSVQESARPLLKKLNASVEEQTAHLEQLLAALQPGDPRRGHELFNHAKTKCITCHARGYNGGRLGPDLTRIGRVRNTRDLVEAIIYPSASLVRGYEPVAVALTDGRILTGIVVAENQGQITLGLDADKRQNIARNEIDEIQPSPVSLMPQGLDKILTIEELSDLVAFLKQD